MGKTPDFTRAQVERATQGMINACQKAGIEVSKIEFDPKTRVIRILRDENDTPATSDLGKFSELPSW